MYYGSKRKLNRMNGFDYSEPGLYFITICTNHRQELFGEIRHGIMGLNEMGCVAYDFWQQIPNFHKNVEIDEFVIMPNHIHGVIVINENETSNLRPLIVGNVNLRSLHEEHNKHNDANLKNDRTKMLLSKIIYGYKIAVKRKINNSQKDFYFNWQKSFYDHIIRNEKSLDEIRKYIHFNPIKWDFDRNNLKHVKFLE